ncbi:MAG: ATP-binding protein [Bacilli bacterium]|jgi:predicted AAA+ superfamily ATPase|nr:ATP-binding protein [Bacilli bacterium]HOE06786.1 ATP-binding protein [Bacilli bacterium]
MRINRDKYLTELISRKNTSLIKIVTGIRRCGKSYLLKEIYYDYLLSVGVKKENIIVISLDTIENENLLNPHNLLEFINSKINEDETFYLILDEIQEVDNFVPLLNSLLQKKNLDVYVTGSNSKFLSTDIVTQFRGRSDQIYVMPLSFKEFFDCQNLSFDEAYDDYINYGGMPYLLQIKEINQKINYLDSLFEEIYLKDIKERYNIRNDKEMEELLNIIASNIGTLISPIKLENTFKSVGKVSLSRNTIYSYLKIFEESFLIKKANRYDLKGKKYINAPLKYYFTDVGLRNSRLNFRQQEEPHIMENIIYNELIRRGYKVDIGVVSEYTKNINNFNIYKQLEVDFVANIGNNRIFIQSAYNIPSKEKREQETRSLNLLDNSFKKVIIVRNYLKPRRDEKGIITICLEDFLLNENILNEI